MVGLKPLENGELAMGEVAERVRREYGGADAYGIVLDELTRRIGSRLGISVDDWLEEERRVDLGDLPDRLLEEPHALGWFHQHFGESDREASHRAHNRREEKHDSASVTTQLYTPRWVADCLAERAISGAESERPSVLDPAVGGGQMLLAAYDVKARRRPEAPPERLVSALSGVDIDARAVEVSRRNLKLHVARRAGERVPAAEESIDASIRVADGLFDEIEPRDVVLTNPPYMGARSMPEELKGRIREEFEPFHRDLYAAFIRRCLQLATGRVGLLAQQTIWFLKSYRAARRRLLEEGEIDLFVHLGAHAFRSLDGEKANVVAFVQSPECAPGGGEPTTFIDLRAHDAPGAKREALQGALARGESDGSEGSGEYRTELSTEALRVLPGSPMSYWLPASLRRSFEGERRLADVADIPGCQNKTGANRRYVREWSDVPRESLWLDPLGSDPRSAPERRPPPDGVRWILYSKGGRYAPWWGNWGSVVDWSEEARAFYEDNSTSNLLPERYRFRQGICYTDFGGSTFNARWMPAGVVFDMAGPAIFPDRDGVDDPRRRLFALLALLNTSPVRSLLNAMNPSIHYQVTDLRRLPLPPWSEETGERLAELAMENTLEVRRIAAAVESSPVGWEGGPVEPADALSSAVERCRERERAIEKIAHEIYGLEVGAIDPIRADHHYFERAERI